MHVVNTCFALLCRQLHVRPKCRAAACLCWLDTSCMLQSALGPTAGSGSRLTEAWSMQPFFLSWDRVSTRLQVVTVSPSSPKGAAPACLHTPEVGVSPETEADSGSKASRELRSPWMPLAMRLAALGGLPALLLLFAWGMGAGAVGPEGPTEAPGTTVAVRIRPRFSRSA